MTQKVWTFLIRGGASFSMGLPQNPPLVHGGSLTIWKMVGTVKLAEMAQAVMEEQGAKVEVYTEEQTEEQARLRIDGPPLDN